ncbi:transposase [Kribbella sp. NPDC023855]|uniref:RNA-guided endonuclease InsQ/TnpB family protein n=1 Tax=Kribbella sp. NPDC023855 TaxID=3154698 RepID=UPI0033D85A12
MHSSAHTNYRNRIVGAVCEGHGVSRFRLMPTSTQAAALSQHCGQARYVWNLAVEQHNYWRRGGRSAPSYLEQARQLTDARAASDWLRAGSQMVQQQALRDFSQAMSNYFAGTHRRPSWRKAGRDEGFRIVSLRAGHVRRLSRKVGAVRIPKVGWVRFRWSRRPPYAKSYRVTLDRSKRWHIAFASVPATIPSPQNGRIVGIDRGVVVSIALSTGTLSHAPAASPAEARRLLKLQRRISRAKPGSKRRERIKNAIARMLARQVDRRRDWIEKATTALARSFDIIRVEDLRVRDMTRSARGTKQRPGVGVRRKASLNRRILASGWGQLVRRLQEKAPGRVEKVRAAYTSQTCHSCGHVAAESRKSQAVFKCVACGHTANADINAARNIAAGHAVTARGGQPVGGPANREPHHATSPVNC